MALLPLVYRRHIVAVTQVVERIAEDQLMFVDDRVAPRGNASAVDYYGLYQQSVHEWDSNTGT